MHIHGLGDCNHTPGNDPRKLRSLAIALVTVAAFSSTELWVSLQSHSLSLLADAGHMVADVFAIAMSLLAAWISQWPPTERTPFGYRRVEILAALVNGLGLLLIGGWIGLEAIEQLQTPPTEILSGPVAITAAIGLGVNGLNAYLLHRHAESDLNLRGAFLHMLADAVSCVGVLLGAIAIAKFGWLWADGVVGVAIALLILAGSIPLIQQSLSILLEQAPAYVDTSAIRQALLTYPEVDRVTQLRIWGIAPGQTHLTASLSVTVPSGIQRDILLGKLQEQLRSTFNVADSTLQMVSAPSVALSMLPNTKIRELIQPSLSSFGEEGLENKDARIQNLHS
ncbi:MAG: cation diffusion facilitator family transporter [Cyanobacteria bacterium P01_F01_bin.4]